MRRPPTPVQALALLLKAVRPLRPYWAPLSEAAGLALAAPLRAHRADGRPGPSAETLPAGLKLEPELLGLAAAFGHGRVLVRPRPRVSVLVIGDEIQPAGTHLASGEVWDVNGPLMQGWLLAQGVQPRRLQVGDDPEALEVALAMAIRESDLVLCSGAASVEERSPLGPALSALRIRRLLWGVAQTPAPGILAGRRGPILVLGLPGQPSAAALGLAYYAAPVMAALQGLPAPGPQRVLAGAALGGGGAGTHFVKARVDEERRAWPLEAEGSPSRRALAQGWLEVPQSGLKKGQTARLWAA